MKIVRLSIPFAFFMLIGVNAVASNRVSSEALELIGNVVKSVQEKYPLQNQVPPQTKTNIKQPNQCPSHYTLGAPVVVSVEKEKIERRSFYLCYTGYAVQFDPATKTPLWSAEKLTASGLSGAKEARTEDFRPDPNVPGPAQSRLTDYRGSGFDRGHMTPAANQNGRGENAMSETFYLTNMVPQVGPNQNRGIWAELESQVRDWTKQRGEVLVVTGPIYQGSVSSIGASKVMIPTSLYKVIIDPVRFESIAFIVPNRQIVTSRTRQLDAGNPAFPQTLANNAIDCNKRSCTLRNFAVPVSSVEQLTGIRFFTRLKPEDHQRITNTVNNTWAMK